MSSVKLHTNTYDLFSEELRVKSVAFSPDGKYLVNGCDNNDITLWSLELQKIVATLKGHTRSVKSVACSPNSEYFASGSEDKTVKLWSFNSL